MHEMGRGAHLTRVAVPEPVPFAIMHGRNGAAAHGQLRRSEYR